MSKSQTNIDQTARLVGRYRFIAGTTVGAVVFLILVGALVRMTGSGMGCPDWPKCFGQWIPPTDLSQLPPDYKTQFAVAGREIADFDAFKTWVEYINRLIGVLIGLFSLATVVASWPLRRRMPVVFRASLAGFVGVLIVGGVGAYVVRTHLQGGIVTIHMMLALAVLALFTWGWLASHRLGIDRLANNWTPIDRGAIGWSAGLLFAILIQIVLGTQVREGVDLMAEEMGADTRGSWLANIGLVYDIHKVTYYSVVALLIGLGRHLRVQLTESLLLRSLYLGLWAVVGGEVLLGLGMHYLDIPTWMQPAHLLLATLLFGGATATLILLRFGQNVAPSMALDIQQDVS